MRLTRGESAPRWLVKLVLSLLLAAHACIVQGAQRTVLAEKLSVTWCPHCMAAAQSLGDLVNDYGDRFIPLEVFSSTSRGGRYQTNWGQSRTFDFYKLSSYPTTWFDGTASFAGSADAYNSYLSRVNTRLAAPTDVVIDVSAQRTGDRTYDVTAAVGIESGGAAKVVRVHLVQALDRFGVYDDNVTVPRNTLKQVLEPGFDLLITPGRTQKVTRTLTLDDDSVAQLGDVKLIAWAQSPASIAPAEVYNAAQLSLATPLAGDFDGNGSVTGADLTVWKNAFGKTNAADANADGVSDGADILAWQRNLGRTSASAILVPEPAATGLRISFCFLLLATRLNAPRGWQRYSKGGCVKADRSHVLDLGPPATVRDQQRRQRTSRRQE